MSDPRTPVTDYQAIVERLRKMEQRLDRLATPSGSSLARAVETIASTVETLSATAYDLNPTAFGDFGSFSAGYLLYAASAVEDASVTLTTTTGRVLVTLTGDISVLTDGGSDLEMYLHIECIGVDTVDINTPALIVAVRDGVSRMNASYARYFELAPGTYTFRTRFGRRLFATGGSQGISSARRLLFAQSLL